MVVNFEFLIRFQSFNEWTKLNPNSLFLNETFFAFNPNSLSIVTEQ